MNLMFICWPMIWVPGPGAKTEDRVYNQKTMRINVLCKIFQRHLLKLLKKLSTYWGVTLLQPRTMLGGVEWQAELSMVIVMDSGVLGTLYFITLIEYQFRVAFFFSYLFNYHQITPIQEPLRPPFTKHLKIAAQSSNSKITHLSAG